MEKKNKKQNRVKDIKIVNKSGTTVLKHFTENLFLLKVFGVRTTPNKEKPKHFKSIICYEGSTITVGDIIDNKKVSDIVKYDNMYDYMIEFA